MTNMIQPIGKQILIRPIEPEKKTSFGMELLAADLSTAPRGVVEAIGNDPDYPFSVKKGDLILFNRNLPESMRPIELNGITYLVLTEDQILCKIEQDEK